MIKQKLTCSKYIVDNVMRGIVNLEQTLQSMNEEDVLNFVKPVVLNSLISRVNSLKNIFVEIRTELQK